MYVYDHPYSLSDSSFCATAAAAAAVAVTTTSCTRSVKLEGGGGSTTYRTVAQQVLLLPMRERERCQNIDMPITNNRSEVDQIWIRVVNEIDGSGFFVVCFIAYQV